MLLQAIIDPARPASMELPLAKLRQVPPMLKAVLKARSITTCNQLLVAAARCDDRLALAQAIHVAPDLLTQLVRQADLSRVKGVGSVFGRMLEELAVGDVAVLANQRPSRLHERLRRHNETNQLARRSPTIDEVTDWIDQARRLPVLVTYQQQGQEATG